MFFRVPNRSKVLGEDEDDEEEEYEDDEVEDDEPEDKTRGNSKPQYTSIRRQRPSTTEGPSTSRYVEIRRGTTPKRILDEEVAAEEDEDEEEEEIGEKTDIVEEEKTPKYVDIMFNNTV